MRLALVFAVRVLGQAGCRVSVVCPECWVYAGCMLVYLGWRTGQLSAYLLLARGNDMTYCSRMAWRIVVQIFFESLELLALDAVRSYLISNPYHDAICRGESI